MIYNLNIVELGSGYNVHPCSKVMGIIYAKSKGGIHIFISNWTIRSEIWYHHHGGEYILVIFIDINNTRWSNHGPLAIYVKLRFAHAPGMPGMFSPAPRVSDADMYHGTCVTNVPWCLQGSITSGFLCRWRGKRSRHSRRIRNPRFYVSGKRPMRISSTLSHIALVELIYCRYVQHCCLWCLTEPHGPIYSLHTGYSFLKGVYNWAYVFEMCGVAPLALYAKKWTSKLQHHARWMNKA